MTRDGMGCEKVRNVEFIIADEATGKFSGLRIAYKCAVVFGRSHLFVPVPSGPLGAHPSGAGTNVFLLRLSGWRGEISCHYLYVSLYAVCSSPRMVSQVLTISTFFGKPSLTLSSPHPHPELKAGPLLWVFVAVYLSPLWLSLFSAACHRSFPCH